MQVSLQLVTVLETFFSGLIERPCPDADLRGRATLPSATGTKVL